MIKNNKKALTYSQLIALIIAIVFMLIMIVFIKDSVNDSKYENDIVMCNQFFNSINGKPLYFGEASDEFTPKLQDAIAELCPTKEVKVTNKNVKPALDLMKDCWFKTGQGVDIMPTIATDLKLCVYCGKITADGEVEDFQEKIIEQSKDEKYKNLVSKESEVVNFNEALFQSGQFPKTFTDKQETYLFYQIQKPNVKPEKVTIELWYKDEVLSGARNMIGKNFDIGPILNYYALDELIIGQIVRTTGGIVAVTEDKLTEKQFSDIQNNIVYRDCQVIIPKNNY